MEHPWTQISSDSWSYRTCMEMGDPLQPHLFPVLLALSRAPLFSISVIISSLSLATSLLFLSSYSRTSLSLFFLSSHPHLSQSLLFLSSQLQGFPPDATT